ncbi:MAG: hypothetical protein AAF334_05865, partial [Pseudomonadota bacterium]
MPTVSNYDDLIGWLSTRPPDASIVIAARAALRTVPLLAEPAGRPASPPHAALILPTFRATAVAAACGLGQAERQVLAAADAAAAAARAAARA